MEGADFPPISGSHIGTTFPRVVLAVPRIIYLPFPLPSGGGGARRGGTGAEGEGGNACPIQDKPPPWDADPRFCREFGPEDYGDEDIVAFLRRLMARDPHGRHRIRMNSNSGRLQLWHYDPSLDDFYEEEEKKEGKGEGEGARGRNKMQSTLCGFRKSLLCQSSRTWSSPSPPPRPWSSPSPPRSAFSRGRPPSPLGPSLLQLEMPQKLLVTEEEADRLAEELVAEEERAKRRAEKKRLKKKRQKERKRQERMEQESGGGKVSDQVMEGAAASAVAGPAAAGASNLTSSPQSPSQGSSNEEEELDLSSTFVSQARRKIGDRSPNSQREKGSSPEPPAWNRQSQSPQEGSRSQSPQPEALPGLQAAALRQSQELADSLGIGHSAMSGWANLAGPWGMRELPSTFGHSGPRACSSWAGLWWACRGSRKQLMYSEKLWPWISPNQMLSMNFSNASSSLLWLRVEVSGPPSFRISAREGAS
ncbi:tetratricopeptide repeat protein 31 isoform X9 [Phascolarctos cinereus]|uniref:Tetratricopeptide repeat protein 31 isoform X9 n=1 Tax=Phascolarctos cinereus TaxID=38626 RepID=A0A6P5LRD6_PHACI|nr:tetratricopeptide repeat protein 31 isoform X9 [Phascolarctos cinereus]